MTRAAPSSTVPISTIRPSWSARSSRTAGTPVPSTIVAPLITQSSTCRLPLLAPVRHDQVRRTATAPPGPRGPASGIDVAVSVCFVRAEQPVFDADMHVQEPPEIWVDFLDPSLRDRVVAGTREQALPL